MLKVGQCMCGGGVGWGGILFYDKLLKATERFTCSYKNKNKSTPITVTWTKL